MADTPKDVSKSPEFLRARRAALVTAAQSKHETPEARTQAQAEAIEQLRADFASGRNASGETGKAVDVVTAEPPARGSITYPEGMAPASVLKPMEKVRAPEISESPAFVNEVVTSATQTTALPSGVTVTAIDGEPVTPTDSDYPTPAMIGAPISTPKAKAGKKNTENLNDTEAV